MLSNLKKIIKNHNENFLNQGDQKMFCFALLKSLYENGFVSDKDKIFLEKKYQYIRIINKDEKRLINVYFEKEPIIDFFQNTEYDKELKYYGINEKDLIIINERLVKEELKL